MTTLTEINSQDFSQIIEQSEAGVLVDFFAHWCGPCKMVTPVLEQLQSERDDLNIVKIDADNAQALMSEYGVRGIPALLLFKKGELVDRHVGAAPINQLREFAAQV